MALKNVTLRMENDDIWSACSHGHWKSKHIINTDSLIMKLYSLLGPLLFYLCYISDTCADLWKNSKKELKSLNSFNKTSKFHNTKWRIWSGEWVAFTWALNIKVVYFALNIHNAVKSLLKRAKSQQIKTTLGGDLVRSVHAILKSPIVFNPIHPWCSTALPPHTFTPAETSPFKVTSKLSKESEHLWDNMKQGEKETRQMKACVWTFGRFKVDKTRLAC